MKRKILQKFADMFIKKLESVSDDEMFEMYYDAALWYNNFCIYYFNVYLD
jgi:hypothetical protein